MIPEGYERPRGDSLEPRYWLEPQTNWTGATPLVMVMADEPGAERILAERCYLGSGQLIVDALRAHVRQPA